LVQKGGNCTCPDGKTYKAAAWLNPKRHNNQPLEIIACINGESDGKIKYEEAGDHSYKSIICLDKNKALCKPRCSEEYYPGYVPKPSKENEKYRSYTNCEPCHKGCSRCYGPRSSDCHPDFCKEGYLPIDGLCKRVCNSGEYFSKGAEDCLPC